MRPAARQLKGSTVRAQNYSRSIERLPYSNNNPIDRPIASSYTATVTSPGSPSLHPRQRHSRPSFALFLLLLVQFGLGIARISIVPLGFNVDELWHFSVSKNVAAACIRSTLGLSWTLYEEPGAFIEAKDLVLVDPDNLNASPCTSLSGRPYITSIGYYLWTGAPMAALDSLSPKALITVGRTASLLFGLAATTLTFFAARNLFPRHNMLPIGAAIFTGLNQHINDIITGVNTDVAATFSVTLLFWTLSRLEHGGVSRRKILFIALALAVCFISKTSAWIGLPIAIIWLTARLSPRLRWSVIAGGGGILIAGIILLRPLYWTVPAHWFIQENKSGQAALPAASRSGAAHVGEMAFLLPAHPVYKAYIQYLPESNLARLRGETVTIGGWVKAPKSADVEFPALTVDSEIVSKSIVGTGAWQYQALTTTISNDAQHVAILLNGPTSYEVLYDGLFLVVGEQDVYNPPQFLTPAGLHLGWNSDSEFINQIQNPSVEQNWPSVQFTRIFQPNLTTDILWSVLSWQRTWTAWLQLPRWFFAMYWSGFGGTNPGLSRTQLIPFAVLSVIASLGLLLALSRSKLRSLANSLTNLELSRVWLLLIAGGVGWLTATLRSDIYPHLETMFVFAGTRHALPVVCPTNTLFMLGLLHIIPHRWQRLAIGGLTFLLFITTVYILLIVQIPFNECPLLPKTLCLDTVQ